MLRSPARWVLPLLVGLIVGLVMGYGTRPLPGSAAAPQANCKKAVGTPVGAKHYTPVAKGGATPLPHATPVKPRPHLILGMITRTMNRVTFIQGRVNAKDKKYAFYLVPSQVITHTLPQYGFKPPVDLVSLPKPFPRYAGRPVRKGVVKYQGALYQVRVAQPGVQGKKGIWMIVTILPQKVQLGGIGHTQAVVARQQHLADTQKKFAFYRNPGQVILRNSPQYGLAPPLKILSGPVAVNVHTGRPTEHAIVKAADGVQYNVYVAQFGKTGAKGIWSMAYIDVNQP